MYNRRPCQGCSPCKCEPIVLPVCDKVCHRCFYVEQPIIVPINTKTINHYIPKPVYYPTYTRSEENVCEGNTQTAFLNR